jgi:hypothetical protein
MLHLEREK